MKPWWLVALFAALVMLGVTTLGFALYFYPDYPLESIPTAGTGAGMALMGLGGLWVLRRYP